MEEYVRSHEAIWSLPYAPISQCVGLDYDLAAGWNSSCEVRELEDDLRRSHARSFNLHLVGDLEGWAKGRMATALVDHYREQIEHPGTLAPDGFRRK